MELRIRVPENISAWRYFLKHPRSFIIGSYGFDRWFETHQKLISVGHQLYMEEVKHSVTRTKLRDARIELSKLKRANTTKETND